MGKVNEIVRKHNKWRRERCLNMIASENVMSPLAEEYSVSDFESRYNEHGKHPHYKGSRYSMEIENYCNKLFQERFNTDKVDSRPISGGIANLCVYNGLLKKGNILVSPNLNAGGHVSHSPYGLAGVKGLNVVNMFFDYEEMQLNVEKTVELIKQIEPWVVMFGRSMFLFPEPLEEITGQIPEKTRVIYDAAHVLGLIYAGEFQQPLEEGADVMTASTHKTFPGPQGGIIIADKNFKDGLWNRIRRSVFPGVISNHHIHRLPSLAITAEEMNEFGEEYAKQTIKNAKALGKALYNEGFNVLCPEKDFTESHQAIVKINEFGGGKPAANKLEKNNIITNKIALPIDPDKKAVKNPSGIRIGTQELTRWGMKEEDMEKVAEFYKRVLMDGENVKEEVTEFRSQFLRRKYCFEDNAQSKQ